MSGYCFDCHHDYRGVFPVHAGTLAHRSAVSKAHRRRTKRAAPTWRYGTTHDPDEAHDRAWLRENKERQMSDITELKAEIEKITGTPVTFSGGGRGQKASVVLRGHTLEATGESRLYVLGLLMNAVVDNDVPDEEPDTKRITVEDAVVLLEKAQGGKPVDIVGGDEPGPVFSATGILMTIVPCPGECMISEQEICNCSCGGRNHGILHRILTGATRPPTMFGPKPCLCGCGGITKRRFVPGHDARYHAEQKRAAKAAAAALESGVAG